MMLSKIRDMSAICFTVLLCLVCLNAVAAAKLYSDRPEVRSFIDELTEKHKFNRAELLGLFRKTQRQQNVLDAIAKPAERELEWKQYRPIFINQARIAGGASFWHKHLPLLKQAENEYGVPAEIIVAIIGVETGYGKHLGRHPVLDSLITLSFDGQRRKQFFRRELEEFLLLTRDERIDPSVVKGSYAGAMGMPQFISSSYRRYAVDFDKDGRRDLWESKADVIGSVANYFKVHGWQGGEDVVIQARVNGDVSNIAVGRGRKGLKPSKSVAVLSQAGVSSARTLPEDTPATLIRFEGDKGTEYWLGLQNFYVITRYNHSAMYAMAVYQLAQQIKDAYINQQAAGS